MTGPQTLSFDEAADVLSQQAGRRIRHVRVAPDVRRDRHLAVPLAGFARDFADRIAAPPMARKRDMA